MVQARRVHLLLSGNTSLQLEVVFERTVVVDVLKVALRGNGEFLDKHATQQIVSNSSKTTHSISKDTVVSLC
jgi:hypothetical protein